MGRGKPRSIYSVYLTEGEEQLVREIAKLNATSVNYVVRTAVRQLAGFAVPTLQLPPRRKPGD
jgi:hypothetical protein